MQVKNNNLINIFSDKNKNLRIGNINIFLEIAVDNYLEILKSEKKQKNIKISEILPKNGHSFNSLTTKQKEQFYKQSKHEKKSYKLVLQGIIILSTFYESLINEIGMTDLGQRYYKDNLDKLSINAKWEIGLKLVYDNTLNKESKYFESFKKLISARNKLVHYKAIVCKEPTLDELSALIGKQTDYKLVFVNAIKNISKFYSDLSNLDKEKNILENYSLQKEIMRLK